MARNGPVLLRLRHNQVQTATSRFANDGPSHGQTRPMSTDRLHLKYRNGRILQFRGVITSRIPLNFRELVPRLAQPVGPCRLGPWKTSWGTRQRNEVPQKTARPPPCSQTFLSKNRVLQFLHGLAVIKSIRSCVQGSL